MRRLAHGPSSRRRGWRRALGTLLVAAGTGLTAGPWARAAETLTFAVIGDSGSGKPEQYAVAREMERVRQRQPYSLVLMLGDNIYGKFNGAESFTQRFEKPYAPLLRQGVRFRAVLGNHGSAADEVRYAPFGMGDHRYYTFTQGDGLVQFFAIDSDRLDEASRDDAQLAWLESELKASAARWKIAYFHQPIYNAGRTHGPNLKVRAALEPLFVAHGVRIVLSGHEHVYQRLAPRGGVTYFIEGASGKVKNGSLDRAHEMLQAGNDAVCSFLLFEVGPDEAAFSAISAAGEVIDRGAVPFAPSAIPRLPDGPRK